jgi:hypothetical protein
MRYILVLFISYYSLFGYDIVDIDFHINLVDSQDIKKAYIIDCGAVEKFVDTGMGFTVYREFDQGINNLIGRIEIYSYGYQYSKCKEVEVSETLRERNLSLHSISIGDYCFPSVKIMDNDLFRGRGSIEISEKGRREINNKVIPMIMTESFYSMKIAVYLDGKGVEGREIELSLQKGEELKKFFINRYKIPITYMEIEPYGNLQNMSMDDTQKNSFIDFVFIPPEVTYVDSVYEEVIDSGVEKPKEISPPQEKE